MKQPTFCDQCGTRLTRQRIKGVRRSRSLCEKCGTIVYQNPKVLVTTIVTCDRRVLLCLRAEAPRRNRWNAPTGFVECGETLEEAAVREIREETHVKVPSDDLHLYAVSTLRDISQVYVSFRAEVSEPKVRCGAECEDVRYFSEEQFPWDMLAYPEMVGFFRLFFRERRAGLFSVHLTHLDAKRIVRRTYQIHAVQNMIEAQRPPRPT